MKVAIAGAGLAGLSVARALVERGLRPVVIAPDAGYSACGAGIASLDFEDQWLSELARRSRDIIRECLTVETCGMGRVALSDTHARALARMPGLREGLPDRLAAALSPQFRRRITHAVYSEADFHVNPQDVLRAFSEGVERVRARIWKIEEGRVAIDSGHVEADWLVLAMGPWSSWLVRGLGLARRRAQVARAKLVLPSMFHVLDSGLFARPDAGGALVGDGDASWRGEPDARAARPTSNFLSVIDRQVDEVFGTARGCQSAGAGLIVRARGGRPVMRVAGRVVLVTGFGRDGLSLAPACGERVAQAICDGRTF